MQCLIVINSEKLEHVSNIKKHVEFAASSRGCNFLLTIGSFLLRVELLLTVVFRSFLLAARAFYLKLELFLLTIEACLLTIGKFF